MANRIFGYIALILGLCVGALFILAWSPSFRPWTMRFSVILNLLIVLLAGNLIYIGWHALARGSIPIDPKPLFRWGELWDLRESLASMSGSRHSVSLALLFGACAAIGTQVAISHYEWVNDLYYGRISGLEASILMHGRTVESLQTTDRLIWLTEFPLSLTAAILLGMATGIIRTRPAINVCFAVGYLFAGILAGIVVGAAVAISLMVIGLYILWFVGCFAAIPVAAVFLDLSRFALSGERESDPQQSKPWVAHFVRTTLVVGLPAGFVLGSVLALVIRDSAYIVAGIEIAWAALYGAALANSDRNISTVGSAPK